MDKNLIQGTGYQWQPRHERRAMKHRLHKGTKAKPRALSKREQNRRKAQRRANR